MIRHLLRLVWNRKRFNFLLMLEIFVSFIVLFSVGVLAEIFVTRVKKPLGIHYDNVYTLGFDFRDLESEWNETKYNQIMEIFDEIERLSSVEAVAINCPVTFGMAVSSRNLTYNDNSVSSQYSRFSDDAREVFGIEMIQGEWFSEEHDALDWTPIVINRMLAEELFGDEDPIGKPVLEDGSMRVVGVIEDFRSSGEYGQIKRFYLLRQSTTHYSSYAIYNLVIRTHPNPPEDFQENVMDIVHTVMPDMAINIDPLEKLKARNRQFALVPLTITIVIAAFLMIMVALGMIGVFWQSITRRREEIGLRRALGSTKKTLYQNLLMEIFLIVNLGSALAAIILVQLPVIGVLSFLSWKTMFVALGFSFVLIYLLSFMSGMYPVWLATRIQPAEALHYE